MVSLIVFSTSPIVSPLSDCKKLISTISNVIQVRHIVHLGGNPEMEVAEQILQSIVALSGIMDNLFNEICTMVSQQLGEVKANVCMVQ